MPRGGGSAAGRGPKKNYKGKRRVFTSAEEIQRQNEEDRREQWREKKETGDEKEGGDKGDADSSEESSSEEDENAKAKGVERFIEIENPNRVMNRTKKAKDLDVTKVTTTLSRREREEIQKQEAHVRYQELHSQGKTQEAMSDLARLSIIRKQREEAAKKRDEEKKAKETLAAETASKKGKS